MLLDFNNSNITRPAQTAEFGIERESLRVTCDGKLAQTFHPFVGDPHLDRDFCENQVEMIGDVFNNPADLIRQLGGLLDEIDAELVKNNELLWAFSNPPGFDSEEEIPVAWFHGAQRGKSEYRHYLADKYGKTKMLFSGIHLNVSFTDRLLQAAFVESGAKIFTEFKNDFYLRLSKRLTQYAWLAVYLTAASPVADASLGIKSNVYSSIRCSEYGYWNTSVFVMQGVFRFALFVVAFLGLDDRADDVIERDREKYEPSERPAAADVEVAEEDI